MDEGGTFRPIGESDEQRYGPRRVLAAGFRPDEGSMVLRLAELLVDKLGGLPLPVTFPGRARLHQRLSELFTGPLLTTEDGDPTTARAVILSGVSEREIHAFMAGYKTLGLERPLWATLTETSSEWTLDALLDELVAERAALQRQGR